MHLELQFLIRLLVAAALYTSIAELAVADIAAGEAGFQADPIRAVQAVAIGIGFLGSGVIFVSRRAGAPQRHVRTWSTDSPRRHEGLRVLRAFVVNL